MSRNQESAVTVASKQEV